MKENRNYYVYAHINKINGNTYIGITRQSLKKRWKNGYGYTKCIRFFNAVKKYGWENFEHIALCKTTKERAELLEITLIKHFKLKHKSYNITDGGEDAIPSMLNKHHTLETKKLISEHSKLLWENNRERMIEAIKSSASKRVYSHNPLSEKTRLKMRNRNIIAVKCFDCFGNYIRTYKSSREAARVLNLKSKHIVDVCKNRRLTCGNYQWRYAKSFLENKLPPINKIIVLYDDNMNEIKRFISISEVAKYLNVSYTLVAKRLSRITKKGYKSFILKYLEGNE